MELDIEAIWPKPKETENGIGHRQQGRNVSSSRRLHRLQRLHFVLAERMLFTNGIVTFGANHCVSLPTVV